MAYLIQQIVNALPVAGLYGAVSFGYMLSFGLTRRADIGYGALFAFAGQILLLFADWGYNRLWLVLPAALAIGLAAGLAYGLGAAAMIGTAVLRPLLARSGNALLVASLGVTLVLMEGARLASDSRALWLPPLLASRLPLTGIAMTSMQASICLGSVALVLAGAAVLRFSRWGRVWAATAQDRLASQLCGLDTERVVLVSYLFAAAIAAICGMASTLYYGSMDFGSGLLFGLKIVLIAAAGGHAHPLKSAGGAALVGLAEGVWGAYGPLIWREAAIFSVLVLILVLTRRERAIP